MTPRPAAALVSPPDPATLDAMLTRLKLTASAWICSQFQCRSRKWPWSLLPTERFSVESRFPQTLSSQIPSCESDLLSASMTR